MKRHRREPLAAPESLEVILERAGESRFARVRPPIPAKVWREAVGARIAERARPVSLWNGVLEDSLGRALPAFFPEQAYAQLKAIGDPASDWTNRLEHDFKLDLGAAHALLGRDSGRAHLIAVHVVSSYGHWVPPGVCSNRIGYYEMPNARVVYSLDGGVRSFGIASMISWRGVWYVVHLGAILRSTDTGTVDAPATGPGASAYSGTC